jgi:hypothetical protein
MVLRRCSFHQSGKKDIIKLLQRNPNNRLGAGGIEELKRHDWMKGVDFARLEKK